MTKFFLDQRGCAKNQVDGEIIISNLTNAGMRAAATPDEADVIIINSCGFIESAKKESLDALLGARKKYKDKKIILAGCLAQRYADVFKEALPEADGIFGNGDLGRAAAVVQKVMAGKRAVETPAQKGVSCGERLSLLSYKNSAYVKISEGCSNHCSFCAIPLIRGELRSRPAADIVAEIKSLLKRGVFEINLIGQDLAAYGLGKDDDVFEEREKTAGDCGAKTGGPNEISCKPKMRRANASAKENEAAKSVHSAEAAKKGAAKNGGGRSPLCRLLEKISGLKGKFWIRMLYIHPDHFNPDVLDVLKKDARILPYFDIPFQSGDDGIIKAMNRKNSASYYTRLADGIRSDFPRAALRATFLAGFPGESDEAAKNTLDFLKAVKPDWSGAFAFSKEEGTAAFAMKKQTPKKIAASRAAALQEAQEKITRERLKARLRDGKESALYDVLIEEIIDGKARADGSADKNSGGARGKQKAEGAFSDEETACYAIGRAWFQAPEVDGNVVVQFEPDKANGLKAGDVVKVRALSVSGVDIYAELLEQAL